MTRDLEYTGGARTYYPAYDVLPQELAEQGYAHVGSKKITFRFGAAALTKSEGYLPEDFVFRCREHLDTLGELETRVVLFTKYEPREVPRHLAYAIAKFAIANGCTVQACANAIGYHYNSLVQWQIRKGTKEWFDPPGGPEEITKWLALGRAHCLQIATREREANANHYAWVGWVRATLVAGALASMRDHIAALADAKGPIEAAEAVYHLPAAVLSKHGAFVPRALQTVPPITHGGSPELARLMKKGREYCKAQGHPVRPRATAWVGWFLEYTQIELAPQKSKPAAEPAAKPKRSDNTEQL